MDGLILLHEAQDAGLTVLAEGDRLRVRGPRRAEAIARRLLDHKFDVIPLLSARSETVETGNWASDACAVIDQFTDPAVRKALTCFHQNTLATLERETGLDSQAAQQQGFGLLLFRILALGIDVKAAAQSAQSQVGEKVDDCT